MRPSSLLLLLCAAPALLLAQRAAAAGEARKQGAEPTAKAPEPSKNMFGGKNVIMFMSDQERDPQDWPAGWVEANLPGMTRLKRNGLTFKRAYTNACMCTAARAGLFTGYLNPQHNARYVNTPDDLKNLATAAKAAGYSVVYKGKMHLSKPIRPDYEWGPADALKYGWTRWNYPDAGANQSLIESGGSPSFNDKRFMESTGPATEGKEGALQWILQEAGLSQPFFLVISLVNPHDVLFYPAQFDASGYSSAMLTGDIRLPPTVNESLATKKDFKAISAANLSPTGEVQQLAYVNFYANLIKQTDAYLVETLKALDKTGLTNKTVVVKTADHGDMGMSHDGQIQKNFNMYEQTTRIPLIYSNPELYPSPLETDVLVSHVDFVPTMAELLGTPKPERAKTWAGVDYSKVVVEPQKAKPVQDYIVFQFDDFQIGQAQDNTTNPIYVPAPCNIRAIIEKKYKFAEYYDANGVLESQYEMYDLEADPTEVDNLAWPTKTRTKEQDKEYKRLMKKLEKVVKQRLQPLKKVNVKLNMVALTAWAAPKQGQGNVTGEPVGGWPANIPGMTVPPGATITLTYKKDYATDKTVDWSVLSGSGSIQGKATLKKGTTKVTGGTGAYVKLKGSNLKFTVDRPTNGSAGTVTITGVASYT
ncbi:MAG: alkaline-phosphatase-like protein [Monoraphidium minutum]|nr:MAG: alkaline-phosphatase-like protein [Monoraphidium minutum]